MSDELCHNCEQPADGGSLPVSDAALYVPVGDETTEWSGVPGCRGCVALHAAAGDRCNEVLDAWNRQTRLLRGLLDTARDQVRRMGRLVSETESQLRVDA